MHRSFLITAAALAALGVVLGAFGAHGLKEFVPVESISTFETGVRYHMYHAFALLAAGVVHERFKSKWIRYSGISFIAGILLFSGSLYLLTYLKATNTVGLTGIGIITPIGGLFFILGWIFMMVAFATRSRGALKPV